MTNQSPVEAAAEAAATALARGTRELLAPLEQAVSDLQIRVATIEAWIKDQGIQTVDVTEETER